MKPDSKIPGIIMIVSGIALCVVEQFVIGVIILLVGVYFTIIPQPAPKKNQKSQSTRKKQDPPVKKQEKKKTVVTVDGAPAKDAYAYKGTCVEYFDALLRGCFPGYEIAHGGKSQANAAWECACGCVNTGKFCSNCGAAKPVSNTWTCKCGRTNTSKFCSECGAAKPAATVSVAPANAPTFVLRQNGQPRLGIHLCGKNEWNSEPVLQVVDCCKTAGYPCLCFYTEFRNEAGYVVDRIRNALD